MFCLLNLAAICSPIDSTDFCLLLERLPPESNVTGDDAGVDVVGLDNKKLLVSNMRGSLSGATVMWNWIFIGILVLSTELAAAVSGESLLG